MSNLLEQNFPPGTKLPNGATVIAVAPSTSYKKDGVNYEEVVVLAMYASSRRHTEYVTWRANTEDPSSTWGGHYYPDIVPASQDFDRRRVL